MKEIPRLTKAKVDEILSNNNGHHESSYAKFNNYVIDRVYNVDDGKLFIKDNGETSEADYDQARRFIKAFRNKLNI